LPVTGAADSCSLTHEPFMQVMLFDDEQQQHLHLICAACRVSGCFAAHQPVPAVCFFKCSKCELGCQCYNYAVLLPAWVGRAGKCRPAAAGAGRCAGQLPAAGKQRRLPNAA
jgi:hypothetical protein